MNVLMISIGDSILSNPTGDSLDRQKNYADALGYIDMIVFSHKKHNLNEKHLNNLSIYPTRSLSMLTFVYDVIKIAKDIIKNKKIDVITTQDPFGTALAGYLLKKKYNIPLHIQNHSSFLDNKIWISEKPLMFNFFNKLAHFTIPRADRLRVVNTEEKKKYIDILQIDSDKIDIAPVPVNIEFWQQNPTKQEIDIFLNKYNIDQEKIVLFWAGRAVEVKNFPYLFKSVSLIKRKKDILFCIAGDMKNSFWNLNDLENKYDLKPIYLGLLTHQELKVMYYLTDLYLHTSDYEGFGLVVSDAQASGRVVVSRSTAGTKDIIDDYKSGYLVQGDEIEFSKKVLSLLSNDVELQGMIGYTRDMVQNKFDQNTMFTKIINSICKTGK